MAKAMTPKTADGVDVCPGMTLFIPWGEQDEVREFEVELVGRLIVTEKKGEYVNLLLPPRQFKTIDPGFAFSTRAGAEAVKGQPIHSYYRNNLT